MAELNEAHFHVHSANKDKKYQGEKIVSWYIKIERADGRVEFLTNVPKEVSTPVDTWLSTIEHK
jgi:hypothetical protein|tara:strand:- start:18 stop:209 length:192 start_codon:yes stop_codon:yes gene_type:complete